MSKKDAVYYTGLIAGLIVGTLTLRAAGVENGLAQLVGGIVVGVGFGYVAEKLLIDDS